MLPPPSHPGEPSSRRRTPAAGRVYRLVEVPGCPHPSLDGLYDSIEEAWSDAQIWCRNSGGEPAPLGGSIGVEVSTAAGEWRTLLLRIPSWR